MSVMCKVFRLVHLPESSKPFVEEYVYGLQSLDKFDVLVMNSGDLDKFVKGTSPVLAVASFQREGY